MPLNYLLSMVDFMICEFHFNKNSSAIISECLYHTFIQQTVIELLLVPASVLHTQGPAVSKTHRGPHCSYGVDIPVLMN